MQNRLSRDRFTTTVLSWIAGYVDTASFLKLNGLFTAHVTGNLVVAGAQIAGTGGEAVWVRLTVIPVFIVAVVLVTVLSRKYQLRLSSFLWLEALLLFVFAIVSMFLVPAESNTVKPLAMLVAGSIGVFAMGVQNALMREAFGSFAPTTVMTGNLTQYTIDAARLFLIRDRSIGEPQSTEMKERLSKFGNALMGFVVGAAFGAFFTSKLGFESILLPAGVVMLLALNAQKSRSSELA